ncbi:MAG: hypothetical protein IAF38_18965 [Bacteroidia bacterium]|nr:hypothetical protein [Bacteroidia bacterium]
MNQVTKTRTAEIFKDENDIVHITLLDGTKMDFMDAVENCLLVRNLSKGGKVLKFVDARSNWGANKMAKDFISSKVIIEKTIAYAILVKPSTKKNILNFFDRIMKSEVPSKMFTDEQTAYNWLMKFSEVKTV